MGLFNVIRNLCSQGKSIIYISHRLEEIFEICDDITIMRDGSFIMESQIDSISYNDIIFNLVGRELLSIPKPEHPVFGKEILFLDAVSNNYLKEITLKLYQNEVLGIFGLVGSGRTSLALSMYGALKIKRGDIYVNGVKLHINSPQKAL